jgi:hypothetical protein
MWRMKTWRHASALLAQLAGVLLPGCGGDSVERAAQTARLATLEEEVRRLNENVAALALATKTAPAEPRGPEAQAAHAPPFRVSCPQPWVLNQPLGASMWTCRSAKATSEGYYPQCSIIFQPQVAIETKSYFELASSASPDLREIKNVKDKHIQLNTADAFEATFEADPKPLPLKLLSVLVPHGVGTYAITCAAPSAAFDSFQPGFRKVVDSFAFN